MSNFYERVARELVEAISSGRYPLGSRLPTELELCAQFGASRNTVRAALRELQDLGLIERRSIRFVGGQAAGCAPVATAFERGTDVIEPVREPDTFVRSLAIGNPADGRYAVELARASGGSIEAIADETTAAAIRDVARLEGIYPETAGGVTLGALAAARRRGIIGDGDEVVALLTGNGLKTPDARNLGLPPGGLDDGRARPGEPGLAPVIRPSLSAFEAWLEGAS